MSRPSKAPSDFAHEDFYAVLKISSRALPDEIPPAYRRAALAAHPDKGGSAEAFQLVMRAFQVLACASSRESYDNARNHHNRVAAADSVLDSKLVTRGGVSMASRKVNKTPDRGSVKRSSPAADVPLKRKRTDQGTKSSAPADLVHSRNTQHFNDSHSLPSGLSKALHELKEVLQAMCIEQRRVAISKMAFRVRSALLTFMETQKKQGIASDAPCRPEGEKTKGSLPLENLPFNSEGQDAICLSKTQEECTMLEATTLSTCSKEAKTIAMQEQRRTVSSVNCRTRYCPNDEKHVTATNVVASPAFSFSVSQFKQDISASAIPKIQRDPRYKTSKYKAQLHIKSLRIYTKSHTAIDLAINDQIVLMQMRLAWIAAWQESAEIWQEHPEYFMSLCTDVLAANGTSESEIGIKAFVSMQVRPWLGKKCFIFSPVMELRQALELQAKLLRARGKSWPHFRAEWVKLMQHEKHARAKVLCAQEAECIADAAYQKHQIFLKKRIEEHKMRKEARSLARKQHQEKDEHARNMRCFERERRMKERKAARQKLLEARNERRQVKRFAFLEKQLAKAVRAVERALDLQARSDAKAQRPKEWRESWGHSQKRQPRIRPKECREKWSHPQKSQPCV
eukprot:gnl/MRDRNA2_/MRDRNA2_59959_c0_seq2.p1 gnl/MRDRNA2_/MRDRNA2_59959_c0~~gnl/MRDRNA2_/MRDRNA2_59959_c0_seq2.p1  ORF type:complete len:624 (+),score=135.72 gnl/MRDRNA2_/MRDRNA2_59959_c0_seq2:194-2065(+)